MIEIKVNNGGYALDEKKLKKTVSEVLEANGIFEGQVSLVVVDAQRMKELVDKYYRKDDSKKEHPILTFPTREMKDVFVFPPENKEDVGEIIIKGEGVSPEKIYSLAEHGAKHLVGKHHE